MITSLRVLGGGPARFHGDQRLHPARQHEPSGWAVLSEVPAETRDGEERVLHGRQRGERRARGRGAEDLEPAGREDDRRGRLRVIMREVPHEEQLPRDRGEQAEGDQEGVEAFELPLFVGTTRLECFEELLDEPARAVGIDDLPAPDRRCRSARS